MSKFGFYNLWVCVCVGFLRYECVYVWVFLSVGVCMFGFFKVWMCVCVVSLRCGCVYVWVFLIFDCVYVWVF